jgi:ATP-dependent Lhr-like helicase
VVLEQFSPIVAEWFATTFAAPTAPQVEGWPPILAGEHTLICAPTGSGKTLAAFLGAIDRLVTTPPPEGRARTRVLYISPLRALAFDIEKNLRAPLAGIKLAAERMGLPFVEPVVAMRTGDSSARDRQRMLRHPPDLLITTPESLYLMLTSSARETLANVEWVIVDEIHAMAPTKRGAHLALSLERLEEITARPPQRIGLSATQRPLEETARFLGGFSGPGHARPVSIVDTGVRKEMIIDVVIPVEDMGDLGKEVTELKSGPASAALTTTRTSIWPSIYPKILDLVLAHRSTIIFCNARRQAERLAARLNEHAEERELAGAGDLVKAHHGSLAREQRIVIEDDLKQGRLRALVATSSLELGIDMGAVDLVIQVESPGAVSRGLQRIGRAGHSVGEPSKGTVFPKHRGDLLEAAVLVRRMHDGLIEHTRYLRNPLDVLAQQIVAHVSMGECTIGEVIALVRRCANFADLSNDLLANVLDLLAGRYPSEEFSELRPRIVWDRVSDVVRARDGAKRLAVTNGGTIPDRGLFGVFLPDGTRVGELDEEMVYESRPGETFLLGASTWRIEDVTFERVTVTPAPGVPGKMPFWHGDRPGRPLEVGRALGAFIREIRSMGEGPAAARLTEHYGLDDWAAGNVLRYLNEQQEAAGVVPDDRTIVVERFKDEIGDWRVCILSPFGTPVHAPWAMAIEQRLLERLDVPVETMWSDDGIVVRLPEAMDELPVEELVLDPDEASEIVVAALPSTSLFSARFRECAGRALLLPRRRPDQRTPLWQQRQRAADLLAVAAKYPSFPILLETSRECLQDVFDVPALREVLGQLRSRAIRLVSVDTPRASPFSQSLLFNWIAAYMYEGDAPLAERRAAALALDRDLLRDLLGAEELRELLDPGVLADLELELQCLTAGRRARSADELHDVLRKVGELSADEIDLRCEGRSEALVEQLLRERRAISIRVAGEARVAAAEDASRYRDALGCALPVGLPAAFTDPVARPLEELIGRYARTHGPFLADAVAKRFGIPAERVFGALRALEGEERIVRGEFRPDGVEREWCDTEVLRQLRRRSLAALRREVEPVEPVVLARFLPEWHGIQRDAAAAPPSRGPAGAGWAGARPAPAHEPGPAARADRLVEAIGLLQGAALPASALEAEILPARIRGYRPADLDELCASGDVVWRGAGAIGSSDGRVRLYFRDQLALLAPAFDDLPVPDGAVHDTVRSCLAHHGATFWSQIRAAAPQFGEQEVLAALWDLVWSGVVTNDSMNPLRAMLGGGPGRRAQARPAARGRYRGRPRPGRLSAIGPPSAAGRWSLVSTLLDPAPSNTEAMHALALQLLERHGIVTREAVLAEGVTGGFTAVYGVLKVLEERGQVRRGYFVSGLGAAQFALPGAVDRLRSTRTVEPAHPDRVAAFDDAAAPPAVVLAATDPAQPYGAALPWPETAGRPARSAGALCVLGDGELIAWFDRRSHHLVTFKATLTDERWAEALVMVVKDGRARSLEVRKVDGQTAAHAPAAIVDTLRRAGFVDGYRGFVMKG